MAWPNEKEKKGLEREKLRDAHYLAILKRIKEIDFGGDERYRALSLHLGGEQRIKEWLQEISVTLREQQIERIPALKKPTEEMISAIRSFAEDKRLHTGTPTANMFYGFIKGEEVDEHTMLRIISHCLFMLNFRLYSLGNSKQLAA